MVAPLIIAGGIAAGASLLGGFLGNKSQEKVNKRNIEQQELDRAYQKEFAQSGIQWRVKDAQEAGVHPLYSMGASIPTFSPVSQSQTAPTGLSRGVQQAGQDISRAVAATSTETQRYQSARIAELGITRGQLENDLLRLQIQRQRAQIGPAFPAPSASAGLMIAGQGDSTRITDQAQLRTTPHPDAMHSEPGATVDVGWARTASGGYAPVPSEDVKEKIEDQLIPELAWALRNYGPQKTPPPFRPPPGMKWKFSYTAGIWQPVLRRKPRTFNRKKSLLRHAPFGSHRGNRRPAYRGRQFRKR